MSILFKLLLAHFIGDFLLQPTFWVKDKELKKAASLKLYLHVLLHGGLIMLLLWDWILWPVALILMFAHGVIDGIKLYAQKENNQAKWFLIDQFLHLISIGVLWYLWFEPDLDAFCCKQPEIWIYATAVLFLTVVSDIIIQILMAKWAQSINERNDESLSRAGKYIGYLERLFVFTFVLMGRWEAIGFLLAAKSIFRFGDLKESKDRKLTEYILIGTLLSFAIATATALVVLFLIH